MHKSRERDGDERKIGLLDGYQETMRKYGISVDPASYLFFPRVYLLIINSFFF